MDTGTTLFEHSYYIGSYMGGILYGLELTVYFMIIEALFRRGNKNSSTSRRFCSIYSTIMVMLSTIDVACNAIWGEEMWITYRDRPGGVPEYITTRVSVWYETLGSVSVVCSVFMGDALLVYRTFLVYGRRPAFIAIPGVLYLAGLGLAINQLLVAGEPHGNFFGPESVKFAVSYYTITISLNIVLTVFICVRLSRVSNHFSRTLGRENAKVYTGAAAILVESAALYSILGIMYLIPYSLHNGTGILFGQLWSKMSGLAPLLIILRVVNGRAWREDMMTRSSAPLIFITSNVDIHPSPSPTPSSSPIPS
ncbi:hypothetical protein GALMADRAFT_54226 [Galerina marginata CBS 339.88]|uniref:Uncharacterized protein n=1 Tax=Galerina marginata (strain CBS 339.88) TaxID=685588 RepID=A0A067TS14_GALM3|nr:hypothetical protein GALMADRAFT_54226 [Galerina marginata CBS 339.88]